MTAPTPAVPAAVLAAVRSVPSSIPVPRPPADDYCDGWERHGAYQIRFEKTQREKEINQP
jgi:hypothetical protein